MPREYSKIFSFVILSDMNGRYSQYKDLVYTIIGAAMNVHSTLRWGLLEAIYNEALVLELKDDGIQSQSEQTVACYYKQHKLKKESPCSVVQLPSTDQKACGNSD